MIDGNQLKLAFTPDHTNPTDAGSDNVYDITITETEPFNLKGAKFALDYSRTRNEYGPIHTEEYGSEAVNENRDEYYGGFRNYHYPHYSAFAALRPDGSITAWGHESRGGI